jgi:hypothetical protein
LLLWVGLLLGDLPACGGDVFVPALLLLGCGEDEEEETAVAEAAVAICCSAS